MTEPITLPAVVTGQHVREVMTRYGLTQQMLADMLGIQRTQVGRWVAGGGLSQESAAAFREVAAQLASGSVPADRAAEAANDRVPPDGPNGGNRC
ncbi:MAG: helix-turn-helix domain-containing protein [Chloroflexota bacterium]|nr:helix-turn-helix domain-containing protein [Chloroflexota bacterium]